MKSRYFHSAIWFVIPYRMKTLVGFVFSEYSKWEIPQNYYDDGLWNLDWEEAPYQVFLLLSHLATIPEFQLK